MDQISPSRTEAQLFICSSVNLAVDYRRVEEALLEITINLNVKYICHRAAKPLNRNKSGGPTNHPQAQTQALVEKSKIPHPWPPRRLDAGLTPFILGYREVKVTSYHKIKTSTPHPRFTSESGPRPSPCPEKAIRGSKGINLHIFMRNRGKFTIRNRCPRRRQPPRGGGLRGARVSRQTSPWAVAYVKPSSREIPKYLMKYQLVTIIRNDASGGQSRGPGKPMVDEWGTIHAERDVESSVGVEEGYDDYKRVSSTGV
eukprot:526871-Amorphochlora_amoeboformis.AAC.1